MKTAFRDTIPSLRLALWAGWKYYRRFAQEYPKDFEQTAAIAALQFTPGMRDHEMVLLTSRVFARTMREYGYSFHDERGWIRAGEAPAKPLAKPCGACGIKPGAYRDPQFKLICRYCRQAVRWREKRGDADPRAILGQRKPSTAGRVVVVCGECGQDFRRPQCYARRTEEGRSGADFCSPDCYREHRRKEVWRLAANAAITAHAIERFQERVMAWPFLRADATIRRGLSKPVKMAKKYFNDEESGKRCVRWEAHCKIGDVEFRVRLQRNDAGEFDAVTVLESEAEHLRQKAARKQRREVQLAA